MAKSIEFYKNLKTNLESVRSQYVGLWTLISRILGNNEIYNAEMGSSSIDESSTVDRNAFDPMCRRAVETICDFYSALVFPSDKPFSLVPSVDMDKVSSADLDWFQDTSKRIVDALYSQESGFLEVKDMFYRDWETFGTGAFFVTETGDAKHPFVVQEFGVDNMAIQDGNNSQPEYAVLTFNWYPQVIVDYFGGENGKLYERIPKDIKDAYVKGDWNTKHKVYCVIHKNTDYSPDAIMGSRKAKYEGIWMFQSDETIFARNTYFENPLSVARYTRIRGEVYGRSDVSNFINTISAINGIIYLAYKACGKMADPAIGIYDNAIAQDTEIDTSAGAVIALDSTFASGVNPIVPIQDIGNIAPITDFLLKYLSEELVKAFKLDVIIPIVQTGGMTATEFVNRLAIQSEVLSGVLMRHLTQIQGFFDRIIGICSRTDGFIDWEKAPEYVKKAITNGEAWYDVKFNNAITNIINSSMQRDFVNTCNSLIMACQLDQSIVPDVDMYDSVLKLVKDSVLENVLPTKAEHEERKAVREQQAQMMQQAQLANVQSQTNKNNAQVQEL